MVDLLRPTFIKEDINYLAHERYELKLLICKEVNIKCIELLIIHLYSHNLGLKEVLPHPFCALHTVANISHSQHRLLIKLVSFLLFCDHNSWTFIKTIR
jgi:hypothetical protein